MICSNCGTKVPENMKFCPQCGAEFGRSRIGPGITKKIESMPAPTHTSVSVSGNGDHAFPLWLKILIPCAAAAIVVVILIVTGVIGGTDKADPVTASTESEQRTEASEPAEVVPDVAEPAEVVPDVAEPTEVVPDVAEPTEVVPVVAEPATEIGLQIGNQAPDFTLNLRGGGIVTLSDLRGKPVLLNFCTTWCPPCQVEFPEIQAVADLYEDSVYVLGIDVGEPVSDVDYYFDQNPNLIYPIAYDPDDIANELYNIEFIPQTWILDANGIIVDYVEGRNEQARFVQGVDLAF
jgi:peroxiredoxin